MRVWDAIDAAREAGLMPLKINMVPLRGINDDELVSFAALTLEQDCHVRFIERMPDRGRRTGQRPDRESRDDAAHQPFLGRLVPLEFKGMGPVQELPDRRCPGSGRFHQRRERSFLRLAATGSG